jgi:hypothetical protein
MPAPKKPTKRKPGPEAERLKIDMPVEEAIKKVLLKKRPKDGWPKPNGKGKG